MGFVAIVPIPFDILDAAVNENLACFVSGFIEFTRASVTSASVTYHLSQEQLGEVGEFRIRKLVENRSELFVKEPQSPPTREWTETEKEYLQSRSTQEEKLKVILEINDKINGETVDLHHKRIAHLEKTAQGLLQRLKSDPFTWSEDTQRFVSLDNFLGEFASIVKSNLRMSFWSNEKGTHKWKSRPEGHAKNLLIASLLSKLGRSALIFDEITSGAGYIDLYVILPNEEKAIIELKVCGPSYSSKSAFDGLEQINHYLQNRDANAAYLLVFDGRKRDFAKNLPSDVLTNDLQIITKVIDVRPNVIPNTS